MHRQIAHLVFAGAIAFAAIALPAPASAQQRTGSYLSAGIGWGYYYQQCGSCVYAWNNADDYVGYLGFGATVKPNMRVGVQVDAFNHREGNVKQNLAFYNLMFSFYPKPASPLWVKIGLGWTVNHASGLGAGGTASGLNVALGLGFDIAPKKGKFAIIPYVGYDRQFTGGDVSGTAVNAKAALLQFGVGLGLRH